MLPSRYITIALPYANGPTHLGHLVEHIQADIYVRARRLRGETVWLGCADDCHGAPIMLKAAEQGRSAEQFIAEVGAERRRDFADFLIEYDHYGSTHSEVNRQLTERVWRALNAGGHVEQREVEQYYDTARAMFLPDRYVKGGCPRCKAPDQYGDSCEVCGSTYSPTDLLNPYSVLSGTPPERRASAHYFVRLADFEQMLRAYARSNAVQPEVANKLDEWFAAGLRGWDVSRDAPYFGFEIPDAPGKYFYVWLDAPIGYLASLAEICTARGVDFEAVLAPASAVHLEHFIGKDILYFHALFWPALLSAAGFKIPDRIHAHGFLTVDGEKMSKSRGTFVTARRYLDRLQPEPLRYYVASRMGPDLADIDLDLGEFVQKWNADIVGKVVNLASRCQSFAFAHFGGRLGAGLAEPERYDQAFEQAERALAAFESVDQARAVRQIIALADVANRYIDDAKPWVLARDESQHPRLHQVLTLGLNYFRLLNALLRPVLPTLSAAGNEFLNERPAAFSALAQPLLDHPLNPYVALATRLRAEQLDGLISADSDQVTLPTPVPTTSATAVPALAPLADEIEVELFNQIDLRVARILSAEAVVGADKLLRLELDLGPYGRRQVFAGIKRAYEPTALIGRLTVVVANLKAREMRFGRSEGMVLAASDERGGPYLLALDDAALPGMRVK